MKKLNYLEENINNSSSLITSFTRIFISMLIFLGLVTGFSAFKEVSREVYTCLDEKFGMVMYSLAGIINNKEDIYSDKVYDIVNHYKIGDVGFSAIIDVSDMEHITVEFISEDAKNSAKELETAIKKEKNFATYIKESYRPKGFMDLNFIAKQKDFKVSSDNYRMRLCSTNVENIYVLTAAGHDQYLWKMIKIIFGAIFLTLIAVPITIAITKKTFKILATQILSLEKAVSTLQISLQEDKTVSVDEHLYDSNNEIGHLANSIKNLATSLDKKSKVDELTQVYNRRKFNEDMRTIGTTLEKDTPVSILFTDIDFFKRYNDFHGHVAGDVCLKKVAAILNKTFEGDENKWAYRYGGEEFSVICTDCNKEEAINVAKLIAKNLEKENIPHGDSLIEKRVTLSVGVATGKLSDMTMDDILMNSDRAVYTSKETGRNRYTHFDDIEEKK